MPTWLIYAVLSAVAAAAVGILGKVGMEGANSTLATLFRSGVMTLFLLAVSFPLKAWTGIHTISSRALLVMTLSGVAGALSWLFYFKALSLTEVWRVAPIDKLSMPIAVLLAVAFLGERPGGWGWLGLALIVVGVALTLIPSGSR